MALAPTSVVQSKTGSITANTAPVVLDNPTQAGNTVTVEITGNGLPISDNAMPAAGFEMDAKALALTVPRLLVYRRREVAAGEGVSGSTPWNFTYSPSAVGWVWRVTEWDRTLEPIYPLERVSSVEASGTSPANLAIPAPATPSRNELVGLAFHYWAVGDTGSGRPFTWGSYTNSYTERDQVRGQSGTTDYACAWSWKFGDAAASWDCQATITSSPRDAGDVYAGLLVLYAGITTG